MDSMLGRLALFLLCTLDTYTIPVTNRLVWADYRDGDGDQFGERRTGTSLTQVRYTHKKTEEWPPCLLHKLKNSRRAKADLFRTKPSTIYNSVRALMTRDINCKKMR